MKASDLKAMIEKAILEHGDIEIMLEDDDTGWYFEMDRMKIIKTDYDGKSVLLIL